MGVPRRENTIVREPFYCKVDHAQATADATGAKFFTNGTGRQIKIKKVLYTNPTGLVQDADNYFNVKLMQAAVVVANWSTQTSAQGTIAADTAKTLVLNTTESELIIEPDERLHYILDETGDTTLPAGSFEVFGEIL